MQSVIYHYMMEEGQVSTKRHSLINKHYTYKVHLWTTIRDSRPCLTRSSLESHDLLAL